MAIPKLRGCSAFQMQSENLTQKTKISQSFCERVTSAGHKVHCSPKVHAMKCGSDTSQPEDEYSAHVVNAAAYFARQKASAGLQLFILGSNQTKLR